MSQEEEEYTPPAPPADAEAEELPFNLPQFKRWLTSAAGGLRNERETKTSLAAAKHFLTFAHTKELPAAPEQAGAGVSDLHRHCISLETYDAWLAESSLSATQPATQRAYLFRVKRYLYFQRTQVALFTAGGPTCAAGYSGVLQHLNGIIKTLTAAATASQSARFNVDSLLARNEWGDIKTLQRSLTQNRPLFDNAMRRGNITGEMPLKDR